MQPEHFLEQFTEWAVIQPDCIAVALVGSYGRAAAKPGSDIDLLILGNAKQLLKDCAWINNFGVVRQFALEDYGAVTSIRVFYEHGLEVEYGITDVGWADLPLDPGSRQVIAGGMVVLLDPKSLLSRHLE